MKKLLVALLIIIYAAPLFATEVHVHYCMNKVTGWSFLSSANTRDCNKCGMKDAKCCKDEVKILKKGSDTHVKSIIASFNTKKIEALLLLPRSELVSYFGKMALFMLPLYHAPPLSASIDFQSLYCHYSI